MSQLFWAGVIALCVIGVGAVVVRALVRLVRRHRTPPSLSLHLEDGHIWTTAAAGQRAEGVAPDEPDQAPLPELARPAPPPPAATQAPPTVEAAPTQAPPTPDPAGQAHTRPSAPTRPLPDADARRRVDAFIDNLVAEMVADTQRSVRGDIGSASADDGAAPTIDLAADKTEPTRPSPQR